jgi:hypothetical protein
MPSATGTAAVRRSPRHARAASPHAPRSLSPAPRSPQLKRRSRASDADEPASPPSPSEEAAPAKQAAPAPAPAPAGEGASARVRPVDKVFSPQESLLSDMLARTEEFQTIYHIFVAVLLIFGLSVLIEEYMEKGARPRARLPPIRPVG